MRLLRRPLEFFLPPLTSKGNSWFVANKKSNSHKVCFAKLSPLSHMCAIARLQTDGTRFLISICSCRQSGQHTLTGRQRRTRHFARVTVLPTKATAPASVACTEGSPCVTCNGWFNSFIVCDTGTVGEERPVECRLPRECADASWLAGALRHCPLPLCRDWVGAESGLPGSSFHRNPFATWHQSSIIWLSLRERWEVPCGGPILGEDAG